MFKAWWKDEEGQALSEYGLLIAVIAVAVIAVVVTFRDKLAGAFQKATTSLGQTSATPN